MHMMSEPESMAEDTTPFCKHLFPWNTPAPPFKAQLQHHLFSQPLHNHTSPNIKLATVISATPCVFCWTVSSLWSQMEFCTLSPLCTLSLRSLAPWDMH